MKKYYVFLVVLICGCAKRYEYIKSEFPQGDVKKTNTTIYHDYIRSVTVYDEFRTSAIFDVLLFSKEVREEYNRLFCSRRGISKKQKNDLLKSHLEEDNNKIVFYILADIRGSQHATLTDPDSIWSPYIDLGNGETQEIIDIVEVDPSPEVRSFFGPKLTNFKTVYRAKFDRNGLTQDRLKLVFSSVERNVEFTWKEKGKEMDKSVRVKHCEITQEQKRKLKNEDFYWL